MKTNFRVLALGMGFASLALCVGCQEDQAKANGPVIANAGPVGTGSFGTGGEPAFSK